MRSTVLTSTSTEVKLWAWWGESGCGKSVTAMTIMKLLAMPPGRIANGQIWFEGTDLVKADAQTMRNLRAKEIAMIFQEPMTSLNPGFECG
jgi:peptide/nickel transport system ATP-binding protein